MLQMENRGYFVLDQREKVAKDSERLENDPPYMEIKTKADPKDDVVLTDTRATWKKISKPVREDNSGLSWQLGAEYEMKKQRLQQELRLEFRNYASQDKDLNVGEPGPQPQYLSLPIGERRSAKNRLRDERNTEYNDFLKRAAGQGNIKRTSVTQVPASEAVCFEAPASPSPFPEAQPKLQSSRREHNLSRRDAATLTERGRARGVRGSRSGAGTRAGAWGAAPQGRRRWDTHRAEESLEDWERRRRQRGRREEYSSTEESYTDEEEEEQEEFLYRRRPRQSKESHYTGRRERRINHKPERIVREQREVKRVDREEDKRAEIRKALSATSNHKLEMPASMRVSERSRSAANKDKAEFATGLMIGVAEGDLATQRRKDRYRQDLLEQMAEQQRNKKKEKELELRVAATGAIDPEKQPDRIKQFGAVNRDYESRRPDIPYRPGVGLDALGTNHNPRPREEKPSLGRADRGPPEKPRVAFPPPSVDYSAALGQLAAGAAVGSSLGMGVPGVAPPNHNFHMGLSSTLGEMVAPRIAGVPPPLPPSLTNTYRTPYDEAYYYYGARNPLDPSLSYYEPPGGGVHPMVYPHMPPGGPPPPGPPVRPGVPGQHGAAFPGLGVGMVPGERSHQSKENLLSYQEALRQQIQEREERKRRDREEKDRYDTKLEAEMKAYDPWGRGGAGAPLRDTTGNLISDLHRMHRTNEEAYINPESRTRRLAQIPLGRCHPSPRTEAPSAHTVSGSSLAQPSQFARGNMFTDKPTAQQIHDQDTYKDFLQKQIEEKRHKEAESRERTRREEEQEERRLAEQRALMQQEYEVEQQKKKLKEMEHSAKNEELIRQAEERRREAERGRREEEEREALRLQHERQSKQASLAQRVPSPPIPALQKKQSKQHPPRPPSSVSQLSSRTVSARSISASHSPPVPARRNHLRATEEQPGVISELSVMRRRLLSEQRRLEDQLEQKVRAEPDTPPPSRHRGRPPVDIFDMARLRAQVSQRATSGAAPAVAHGNMQNIREFNQLKYRDSASREEVRHVYPDPPGDERSLDIQQQALLREQQRTLRTLRRRGGDDVFEQPEERQKVHQLREKPGHSYNRLRAQGSDSALIDWPEGKTAPVPVHSAQSSRQASAQDRARARDRRPARRGPFQDELGAPDLRGERYDHQTDAQSLNSITSLDIPGVRVHNQARITRLDHLDDNNWGTGGLSGDNGDNFSLRSSPYTPHRRVSEETVATEAWLRPGTSDTVTCGMAGGNRRDRPSLDQEWDGPSTYHG
ncbi:centrosome and spindle pole-associated protein 1 [Osmerus eperlanus]|uniref:centrosome and spindle pole-associated protein 1 n=1 Tax=Osmerus eperlanus TaxID=29151 RepID=UPI002E1228AF